MFLQVMTKALVFVILLSIIAAQTPCPTDGWFGPNCQYQCHCANSAPCDKVDGSCSSGCHSDWFGPACQYERATFTASGLGWLTDKSDTTCNTGSSQPVTVDLNPAIPLTWVRMVFNDAAYFNQTELSYKLTTSLSFEPCTDIRTAKVEDVTLDIYCPTDTTVDQITLSGSGVTKLCALYISGGRNVALKQPTQQSTRYDAPKVPGNNFFLAEYAVDGRVGNGSVDSIRLTCTHTDVDPSPDWWTVNLTQPADIIRVLIFNRNDRATFTASSGPVWLTDNSDTTCNTGSSQSVTVDLNPAILLSGVRVVLNDAAYLNQIELSYKLTTSSSFQSCTDLRTAKVDDVTLDIYCPTDTTVDQITLSGSGVTKLCSLYISGDINNNNVRLIGFTLTAKPESSTTAIPYTYTDRQSKAQASYLIVPSSKISFPVSQVRVEAGPTSQILTLCEVYVFGEFHCPSGTFGLSCERQCNCVSGGRTCFIHSGGCPDGCATNYGGEDCYDCAAGKYGANCDLDCSVICGGDNSCNRTTGVCSEGCDPGYTGDKCLSECNTGTYGVRCSSICSSNCAGSDNACDHISGACNNCPPGKQGSYCLSSCSVNCGGPDNACDRETGVCDSECDTGFYGNQCQYACSTKCGGTGKICHRDTGRCDSCPPGYYGDLCSNTCSANCAGTACNRDSGLCINCPPGRYGTLCLSMCNVNCGGSTNICNIRSGECDRGCDPGYHGVKCDQACAPGTYGLGCQESCSEHCVGDGSSCHYVNGTCNLGCNPGYQGDLCNQACPRGRYGPECVKRCSIQCAGQDNPCHHVDGVCYFGCVEDDQSQMCRGSNALQQFKKSQRSESDVWGITATTIAIVVAAGAVAIVVLYWRKHKAFKNLSATLPDSRIVKASSQLNKNDHRPALPANRPGPTFQPTETGPEYVYIDDLYDRPKNLPRKSGEYENPRPLALNHLDMGYVEPNISSTLGHVNEPGYVNSGRRENMSNS